MVSVLITGCMVIGPTRFHLQGYVYVRRGIIEDVGEGEPSVSSSYADLVLGVQECAVLPGLAVVASPTLYALRSELPAPTTFSEAVRIWRGLKEEVAQAAAVLSLYEASLEGITSVLAVDMFPHQVLDAYREVGLRGGLLVPTDCAPNVSNIGQLKDLVDEARGLGVSLGIASCKSISEAVGAARRLLGSREGIAGHIGAEGVKIVRYRDNTVVDEGYASYNILGEATILYIGGFAVTTLWPLSSPQILGKTLYERAWRTWKIITGSNPLEPRARADIVVLDCSGVYCIELKKAKGVAPLPARPSIEAVLSAGEVLVDQGHHLGLRSKAVERYTAILLEATE